MNTIDEHDDDLAVANADSHLELMDQLELIRNHSELSVPQVAASMGIKENDVSDLESGTTNPSTALVDRYAVAVGAYVMRVAIPKHCKKEWIEVLERVTELLEERPWIETQDVLDPIATEGRTRMYKAGWTDSTPSEMPSRQRRKIFQKVQFTVNSPDRIEEWA